MCDQWNFLGYKVQNGRNLRFEQCLNKISNKLKKFKNIIHWKTIYFSSEPDDVSDACQQTKLI